MIGSGGREHAIAWKLRGSRRLSELVVAPGNVGTAEIAENVPIQAEDVDGLLSFAGGRAIDLTVVGPEVSLAAGIVDRFQETGLAIFGPTRAAAQIETSKSFAKELMLRHGVPTGAAEFFDDYEAARDYVASATLPLAVKADGLAVGKGVTVADTREEALAALRGQLVEGRLGSAGQRVLVEEFLAGREISVFAFVDGLRISSLVAACDYKRVGEGDTGPNTGGMGSYSPPPDSLWNRNMEARVRDDIMVPVVRALAEEGMPYRGVLYAGLMVAEDGPRVVEFNCRLGDPETQVVLPRLKTDLLDVLLATAQGDLSGVSLEWDQRHCVGVVIASGGYPGSYSTGHPITGLNGLAHDVVVFHAGTKVAGRSPESGPGPVSDGGRVLTVSALDDTLEGARETVYSAASDIRFNGSFYRRDIADLP